MERWRGARACVRRCGVSWRNMWRYGTWCYGEMWRWALAAMSKGVGNWLVQCAGWLTTDKNVLMAANGCFLGDSRLGHADRGKLAIAGIGAHAAGCAQHDRNQGVQESRRRDMLMRRGHWRLPRQ